MKQKEFIDYVHSFRGFAILNVVIIHALVMGMMLPSFYEPDDTLQLFVINEALFHDSTLYFAVISGLLYTMVLRPKGYMVFFRNKLFNVISPYIFCTVVFSLFTGTWGWQDSSFMKATPMLVEADKYIEGLWNNLLHGEAQVTYWYIPVLCGLYLLTPLFDAIVFNPKLKSLAWLIMLTPIVVTRPPFDPSVHLASINAVIYFAGAYVAGMYIGLNLKESVDAFIRYKQPLLLIALLATAVLIWLKSNAVITVGITTFEESMFYVQKIAISALVLAWLRGHQGSLHRWLKPYADNAFSLYFLHFFYMNLLLFPGLLLFKHVESNQFSLLIGGLIILAVSLFLSLATIKLTKLLLGKRSRLLVGS